MEWNKTPAQLPHIARCPNTDNTVRGLCPGTPLAVSTKKRTSNTCSQPFFFVLVTYFGQPPSHRRHHFIGKISIYFVHAGLLAILMFLLLRMLCGHLFQTTCPAHAVTWEPLPFCHYVFTMPTSPAMIPVSPFGAT